MASTEIPATYEEWFHCITVKCKIPLTAAFARQRVDVLSDMRAAETRKFTELYGDSHRLRVIEWFRQSAKSPNTYSRGINQE